MGDSSGRDHANQMADQQFAQQTAQQNQFQQQNQANQSKARERADTGYGNLTSLYGNLLGAPTTAAGTAGGAPTITPTSAGTPTAVAAPADGMGYTAGRLNSLNTSIAGLQNPNVIAQTDPTRAASIMGNGVWNELQQTGGVSDQSARRMQGGGVYDEFAQTGGYSPQSIAAIRARSNAPISSLYSSLRNQANQGRIISGGYGPGASALSSRLARSQAGAIGDQALKTETDIADRVNQGRLAGASGLSSTEGALNSLRNQTRLSATQGLSGATQGLENSRIGLEDSNAKNRISSLSAALSGENNVASGSAAADLNNRTLASQTDFANKQLGLAGLNSLYTQAPGAQTAEEQLGVSGAGTYFGAEGNTTGQYYQANPATHWWDPVSAIGGAAAGIGGAMTGFGGLKKAVVT